MNNHLWWYTARAAGIVSWALVAASVMWGVSLAARLTRRPTPAWVQDVHRFLGGLAVVFTGIHIAGLVGDNYTHFGPSEILVPFASTWNPSAVAWGIAGFYLLLAVELTSLMMRRLPRKLWRAIHLSSFGLYVVATVHLFTAGTDRSNAVLQVVALLSTAMIVFLTLVRVMSKRTPRAVVRSAAVGAAAVGGPTSAISRAVDGPRRHAPARRQRR